MAERGKECPEVDGGFRAVLFIRHKSDALYVPYKLLLTFELTSYFYFLFFAILS